MNQDELQTQLRKLLRAPDLEFHFQLDWGSQTPSHRQAVHLELESRLTPSLNYSSISHCTEAGGILLGSSPVGLDIEVSSRVKPSIIQRIASESEVSQAPNPAALWCAKEASFKALRSYVQPSVISQISIGGWEKIDSQTGKYFVVNSSDFQAPILNKGVIIRTSKLTLSFFIFYP